MAGRSEVLLARRGELGEELEVFVDHALVEK